MDNERDSRTSACECEQYKAYLEDVGNIGVRHENSRRFYLSVVSALFVFLAMAGGDGPFHLVQGPVLTLIGIVGLMLCIVWIMHMLSFGALYRAKFTVLRAMEERQKLFHVFAEEWAHLQADPRYRLLTVIDSLPPVLFAILFIVIMFLK